MDNMETQPDATPTTKTTTTDIAAATFTANKNTKNATNATTATSAKGRRGKATKTCQVDSVFPKLVHCVVTCAFRPCIPLDVLAKHLKGNIDNRKRFIVLSVRLDTPRASKLQIFGAKSNCDYQKATCLGVRSERAAMVAFNRLLVLLSHIRSDVTLLNVTTRNLIASGQTSRVDCQKFSDMDGLTNTWEPNCFPGLRRQMSHSADSSNNKTKAVVFRNGCYNLMGVRSRADVAKKFNELMTDLNVADS